ncbi:MAG: BON domain-containing protein [Holosporaceae bacterium]|jgi:osmotically-inducible protein OsmY|nr:BON domain-containing protein [Holosporaceae bacterium]
MKVLRIGSLSSLLLCGACDPVTWMFGGSALVGVTAARNQQGIFGSISDTELQAKINHALVDYNNGELFSKVELSLKHGMVVVIGYVDDESQHDKIMEIVKGVKGSTEIFDEIHIEKSPSAADVASDSSITSRLKSSFFFDSNVSALNYDVTTVKGIVYICGTASTKFERDVVLNHARSTAGVKKVVAYVKIDKSKGS